MASYIIVGNSAAANAAAEGIRSRDKNGRIIMFSREAVPFYYIPALPEFLAGEKDLAGITIHDRAWYDGNTIALHLATPIVAADISAKTVTAADGTVYHYDRLLLAAGGISFIPPIPGADLDGVCALRTYDDARRIRELASGAKELVLIGGGLLGLEAGNGLRKAGLKVSVVEFFPRLLPRQMDPAGAAILQQRMEAMGFSFYLGAKTRQIIQRGNRLAVELEGGASLGADIVLVSAGVRPDLTLPKMMGLACDKALKVDDAMKTSAENVFAAGDIAEHRGIYYGIWPAAMEQGRVAGSVMAGGDDRYTGTVISNSLKVVGINLTAAGDIDPDGKLESIVQSFPDQGIYRKLVIKDSTIVGTILLGDVQGSSEILSAIKLKKDISAIRNNLSENGFDFSKL